jgi:hypothetical protein
MAESIITVLTIHDVQVLSFEFCNDPSFANFFIETFLEFFEPINSQDAFKPIRFEYET